jgi:predicted nucleic acid-binding protein
MIVVDASVVVKWFCPEEDEALAQRLLESEQRLIAPALVRVEVAAAITKKARRGEITPARASFMLDLWYEAASGGPLVIVPDQYDLPAASHIALTIGHPLHDCLYLALAERHGAPLVTADRNFHRRAGTAHPSLRLLSTLLQ